MAVVIGIGVQQVFGSSGCQFGAENSVTMGVSANQTLAEGLWMVILGTQDSLQYTPDAGTTFRTLAPVGTAEVVFSDGFNVRIHNSGTAGTTTYYTKILAHV